MLGKQLLQMQGFIFVVQPTSNEYAKLNVTALG